MKKIGKILVFLFGLAIFAFFIIQLLPFGKDHTNPPVTGEPAWDSPRNP